MPFNLLDYIIITIIILSIISGLRRGFILAFSDLIVTLLAGILALVWYDEGLVLLNEYSNLGPFLAHSLRNKLTATALSVDLPLVNIPLALGAIDFKDMADLLAHWSLIIISFILVFLLCLIMLKIIVSLLNKIASWGFLSWINKLLGLVLVPVKNLLIIMLIAGLIFPAVELAAHLELGSTIVIYDLMRHSYITAILLDIFTTIKGLGIGILGVGNYIN